MHVSKCLSFDRVLIQTQMTGVKDFKKMAPKPAWSNQQELSTPRDRLMHAVGMIGFKN